MGSKDVSSLISLLDDSDSEVAAVVMERLCAQGEEVIPWLEAAWERCSEGEHLARIERVIAQIQENATLQKLRTWVDSGAKDMLTGVFYLNKLFSPDVEFEQLSAPIQKLGQEVWMEFNEHLTALEHVRLINDAIYERGKLVGRRAVDNDRTMLLSEVLRYKQGCQMALGLLYICVAEYLEVPISGIRLPGSGMLCYRDTYNILDDASGTLFYIDPHNGALCGKPQLSNLVKKHLNLNAPLEQLLGPCKRQVLLHRYSRLLSTIYHNDGKHQLSARANRAANILGEETSF